MGGWYNLTSILFTLIIPLTTHNNTSDICSYKPYTEKKNEEKKYIKKINREKEKKTMQKLFDMYIDSKSQVQKNNNIAISFSKEKHKIIKSTVTPFKQSLIQHYTS